MQVIRVLTKKNKNKILDVTILKVFADDRINEAQMMISVFDRVENIVGKGENAGYQHFLLFPHNVFERILSRGSLKVWIVCLTVKPHHDFNCFIEVIYQQL